MHEELGRLRLDHVPELLVGRVGVRGLPEERFLELRWEYGEQIGLLVAVSGLLCCSQCLLLGPFLFLLFFCRY